MTSKDPLQLIEEQHSIFFNKNRSANLYDIIESLNQNTQALLALVKSQREIVLNAKIDDLIKKSLIFKFNIVEKEIFSPKEEGKDGN